MRRLYQKIYLTIIASLLVVLFAVAFWQFAANPVLRDRRSRWRANWSLRCAAGRCQRGDAAGSDRSSTRPRRTSPSLTANTTYRRRRASPTDAAARERRLVMAPAGPSWRIQFPDDRWLGWCAARHRHPVFGMVLFLGGSPWRWRSAPFRWFAG